ncbi:MAG: MBL fold metallo-hydrolase [Candidatus Syntrophopropionicum ammoniitolerans]
MLHADDVELMDEAIQELSNSDTFRSNEIATDRSLQDGDKIEVGKLTLEVIHTPGHTKGSICLKAAQDILFTGDTIFAGSIGYVDGPDEFDQLMESIKNRVLVFPPETKIYPGHGPGSVLGDEEKNNPILIMLETEL